MPTPPPLSRRTDAVRIDLRETIAYVSFATRAEGARAQALLHGRAWEAIRGRAMKAAFASRKQRRSNIRWDARVERGGWERGLTTY